MTVRLAPNMLKTLPISVSPLLSTYIYYRLFLLFIYYQIYQLGTGRHTQKAQACTRCLPIAKAKTESIIDLACVNYFT